VLVVINASTLHGLCVGVCVWKGAGDRWVVEGEFVCVCVREDFTDCTAILTLLTLLTY